MTYSTIKRILNWSDEYLPVFCVFLVWYTEGALSHTADCYAMSEGDFDDLADNLWLVWITGMTLLFPLHWFVPKKFVLWMKFIKSATFVWVLYCLREIIVVILYVRYHGFIENLQNILHTTSRLSMFRSAGSAAGCIIELLILVFIIRKTKSINAFFRRIAAKHLT